MRPRRPGAAMTRKKRDGRRNNGRPPTPNGEAQTVVRGPAALFDAMRELAARLEVPQAEAWRMAARLMLETKAFPPRDPETKTFPAGDVDTGEGLATEIDRAIARGAK